MKTKTKKRVVVVAGSSLALVLIVLGCLYGRYGGGEYYPDVTGEPVLSASAMTEAARYHEPIGNAAATADGRLFFTVHPESRPERVKLLEWREGEAVPYPSLEAQEMFDTVLGLAVDGAGTLWAIDHGNHGMGEAKIVGIDLETGEVVKEHVFSGEVAPVGSFLQDLNVSSDGRWAYVADVSFWRKEPALVVVDLKEGRERRVLEGHESVYPQDYIVRTPTKEMTFVGGVLALKPGVDGIALSPGDDWVAFAAMTHDTTYRIPASALQDWTKGDDALAREVTEVGKKPLSDGISIDREGSVLVTDVEHGAVVRQRADGRVETLVKDERVRWSDGLSHGEPGALYLADSAIPDQMLRTKGHIASRGPYFIWRISTDVEGVAGR